MISDVDMKFKNKLLRSDEIYTDQNKIFQDVKNGCIDISIYLNH